MTVGPIVTIHGLLFSELAHCCGYHAEEMSCFQSHLGIVKQRLVAGRIVGGKGQSVVLGATSRRSHLEQEGERSGPVSWIHF